MDLLKQCTTTVHLIQGYSTIQYRVYELSAASLAQHIRLKEDLLQNESLFKEYLRVQAIRTTEWALRNNGVLVAANVHAQLWLFGTSQEQLNEKLKGCGHVTDAAFSIDGVPSWRFLRSGSVYASDILKDPTMTQKPATAASAVDQFKASALAGDAPRSKSSSPLPDDPQFSHTRMHLFFMVACMQSIVLQMSKVGGVIQMNFRTVAIQQMARWTLCGLDISLTQKGDILVSMNTDDISITNMTSSLNYDRSKTSRHSTIVRVAPAGRLGRVLPDKQPTSSSNIGRVQDSSSVAAWRKSVVDVLARRYITVKLEGGDDAWCRVRLSEVTKDMLNRRAMKVLDEQGAFEWPKELCFDFDEHNSSKDVHFSHHTSSLDDIGLTFFAQNGENIWKDPLDEAEEVWNLARSRDDTGEDDVMGEEVSTAAVLETGSGSLEMDWEPPPLQHVQDMEKAALLYPTPPDGAPASTVSAHLVSEQSSDQRKEVGDDFQDLFDDPTVNITEDDFSYFDQLDPYQRQAQAATVSIIALSDTVIEDQPVLHGRSHEAVVTDDSKITTPQNSKPQTQGQYVAAFPRHKVDQGNTLSPNKTSPILENFPRSSFPLPLGSDHMRLNLDKKYSRNGRFGSTDINKAGLNNSKIPELNTSTSNPNALMNINPLWKRFQPSRIDLTTVESDSESSTSDSRQESESAMRKGVKRVKIAENGSVSISSSVGTPTMHDASDIASKHEQSKMYHYMFLHMLTRSSHMDWSLSSFPAPSGKLRICNTSSTWTPESFIETAQLASAQLVTSTSPFMPRCPGGMSSLSGLQDNLVLAECTNLIRSCLVQAFDAEAVQQDVFVNSAIQSINKQPSSQKFQPKPVPRRNIIDQADRSDNSDAVRVYDTPAPMLRVQRCENELWDLLPPAYAFWQMLDLAPVRGPKTVKALFLYPDNMGLRMQLIRFTNMLKIVWQGSRLGSHDILYDPHVNNGWIPVRMEFGKSLKAAINAYRSECLKLAERLRSIGPKEDETIVIYIVNPFATETALFDLCSCFQAIIENIFTKAKDETDISSWTDYNPPVLQLIPIRMIVSLDGPVMPDPQATARLCREVYGRCPGLLENYKGDALTTPLTNAIELADDPAKDFSFQLTTIPPSSLLQDNSCLHIAYCRSYDDLWITAAWTDDTGSFQHQASYYMGKGQSVANIAREIWVSTFDFINSRKVHWHLVLASAAPMPLAERKIWRDLAVRTKPEPNGPTFNLTLISTNTAPVFQIYPRPTNDLFCAAKVVEKDTATLNLNSLPYSTPANVTFSPISTTPAATAVQTPMSIPDTSTPRTSFFPPNANPLNTPVLKPADNDPSTRLIDLTDETCGIILSRRLNVARAVIDYHPALASGYLVKRTGVSDTDVAAVLEVNIMAIDLVPAGTIPRGLKPNVPQQQSVSGIAGKAAVLPLEQASAAGNEAARLAARQKRYDVALREVLAMYRRLALLAKVRGLQDQKGTAPWHVVVVMRIAEGLRRCAGVPDAWK